MATPSAAFEGIGIAEAARVFQVAQCTVRGWVRAGAPTLILGGCGRGRGSRFDPEKLREWLVQRAVPRGAPAAASAQDLPGLLSRGLWAAFTRPAAEGGTFPAWQLHRIPRGAAAALLVDLFRFQFREATGRFPTDEELPVETERLISVYLNSLHSRIRNDPDGGSGNA